MNEPTPSHHKVKGRHLQRDAYLYIRQSSMRQVLENTESTKRQYQLRERALALGWQSEQIHVIDCDQGRSGVSETGRDGFQQLVAEVSLGKAGIVMGLEVSRLARNNADWHRLLQLCAFANSLILDQDGLYDPASFNDRLLLGLKGAMSEAELHVLKSRLQEGILNNPRYAGAFAYGRSSARRGPDGRVCHEKQRQDQWVSLVPDAHEGYISWEDYQRNQKKLAENAQAYSSEVRTPPREGPALLQGLLICGICGKRMTVRYHQRRGQLVPDYICQREKIEQGHTNNCQRLPGGQLDSAVIQLLEKMVTEKNINIAIAVQAEVQQRLEEADRLRQQQVERCRYEADLARRRYLKVDPDKRFVAEALEAEWNERLRDLDEAQTAYDQARLRDQLTLESSQLEKLHSLPEEFAGLWKMDSMAARDRKRIVRLLVDDVTLIRSNDFTEAHFRFKGGACKTLTLPRPLTIGEVRKTSAEIVREIDRLLDQYPEYRIAAILNSRGLNTATGQKFSQQLVERIRIAYSLPSRHARLLQRNKLSARQLAAKLGVSDAKFRRCRELGLLKAHEFKEANYLYDDVNCDIATTIPQLKPFAHLTVSHTTNEVQYAT